MKIKKTFNTLAMVTGIFLGLTACSAEKADTASPSSGDIREAKADAADRLAQGFQDPPNSARPRVWWHWMNGNISKEGIRKDIEWMARVGIGGLQNFDAALHAPQLVGERLVYMTPEWKDAFHYAAEQAAKHDLELAIAGSPGWSETGGPWVKPVDGMKKLVWSELVIPGGEPFSGKLPAIPETTGTFQNVESLHGMSMAGGKIDLPRLSRDTVVLAVPLGEEIPELPAPRLTSSGGEVLDVPLLTDGEYGDSIEVAKKSGDDPATIYISHDEPQTVRSLNLFLPGAASIVQGAPVRPVLEAGDDGRAWREIATVPVSEVPTTVGFPPVTAKQFRVVFKPSSGTSPLQAMGSMAPGVDAMSMFTVFGAGSGASVPGAGQTIRIAELDLQAEPRVNAFELKAGFALTDDYYEFHGLGSEESGVAPDAVVNLTEKMGPDGHLEWTPPPGRWKVIRMGYSLTGKTNHPAPQEATGLEVDKYDGEAVRRYMQAYLEQYRDATGDELMGEKGLQALLTDSIEVGPSNWTPGMVEHFRRLRGYDPTPWLPALTGVIVGSRQQSDEFLYDFRRTLGDLIASEHYGVIAEVAGNYGLTYYSEAQESLRSTPGDDMAMRAPADVPMAAFWAYGEGGPNPVYELDIKGAASVAHIYGQNLVAAESLTSMLQPWAYAPADLRPMMDLILARGVNRPVIHTSVHQPADDKFPGLALLIFGQYFNRHETWAEMAKPWVDYMARSSYLLQQGRHFADVAYFYGEEAPLTTLFKTGLPDDAPTDYAFDFINADALHEAVEVEGDTLVTTGGARYRVLYLGGNSHYMTLPVLRRLAELVERGATVVGEAPRQSPSLNDDPAEFDALVTRLWGDGQGAKVGKGRVISSTDVEAVLASLDVPPDFALDHSASDSTVLFQHRRLEDGDIYFLSNREAAVAAGEARFRVTGKRPEIWRADTGETRPLSYRIEEDVTVVELNMAPKDAFFVVFREPADSRAVTVERPDWQPVAGIDGPWQVSFQSGRGAPESITMERLTPLNEHPEPGVRYFSGVAAYNTSFELPERTEPGQPLMLHLGDIGEVAEVFVNGQQAGTAWREPYRVDIGEYVEPGTNELEIRVANLWVNRLIGDVQPGAEQITWTSTPIYRPDAPLRESGLMGPVRLLTQQ